MTQRPKWLGNFYGGNLGFLNYEVLTIQHIPRKELRCEAELMGVKWFDYRRLHPMQATYYFVKCWTDAYRSFVRRNLDAERAPYVRCVKERDFLDAKEKLSIWRLRQKLDRLGMRYDFFLMFALRWFYRFKGDNGAIYAPRPSHMASNDDLLSDAIIAWEEQCATSLQFARDPYFRVANFNGCDTQRAHEAFVLQQIKKRRVPHFALHAAMYLYDVVSVEEAVRQLGEPAVRSAIAEVDVTQT